MFKRYESLPKTVEAVQFTHEGKDQILNELVGQHAPGFEDGKPTLKVTTIHGEIAIVRIDDWIVKETKDGFYYPVKDNIFKTSYINDAQGNH